MWVIPIKSINPEFGHLQVGPTDVAELDSLQRRSSFMCGVGRGRKLLFVLGWLSPTLISSTNYLWMGVYEELKFRKSELIGLRKVFKEALALEPGSFFAEVDPDNRCNVNFLRFMGFEYQHTAYDGRAVYKWSK